MNATSATPPQPSATRNSHRRQRFHLHHPLTFTQTPFFAVNNRSAGGVHVLLLTLTFRLDLGSQSIIFHAACIPLTLDIVHKIARVIQQLLSQVSVDDAELSAWKAALPAIAERARTWTHEAGDGCAYNRAGRVPLSFKDGEGVLCGCGASVFPDGGGG